MTTAEALEAPQPLTAHESSALSARTIVTRTLATIRNCAEKEGRRNLSVGFTDIPIWAGLLPGICLPAQSEEQRLAWESEIKSLGYTVERDEQWSRTTRGQTVYRISW